MMSRGRYDEAIPVLKDIVAANPADQDARIALAVTLLGTGDLASAALEIGALRASSPDRAEVLFASRALASRIRRSRALSRMR